MRRILIIIGLSLLLVTPIFASNETMVINGKEFVIDTYEKEGRKLIPLREVANALDLEIWFNPKGDNSVKNLIVVHTKDEGKDVSQWIHLRMNVDYKTATYEGKDVILDVPPILIKGKTYVPLRFICDVFKKEIEYKNGIVYITDNNSVTIEEKEDNTTTDTVEIKDKYAFPTIWNNDNIKNPEVYYRDAQTLVKQQMKNSMSAKFDVEVPPSIFYFQDTDIAVSGKVWGTNSYGGYIKSSYDVIFYDGNWMSFAVYIDGEKVITNKF